MQPAFFVGFNEKTAWRSDNRLIPNGSEWPSERLQL